MWGGGCHATYDRGSSTDIKLINMIRIQICPLVFKLFSVLFKQWDKSKHMKLKQEQVLHKSELNIDIPR